MLTVSTKGITKDNALKVLLRVRQLRKATIGVSRGQGFGFGPGKDPAAMNRDIENTKKACTELLNALAEIGGAAVQEAVKGELSVELLLKE